jgi:ketosteroid isomerase-like protein
VKKYQPGLKKIKLVYTFKNLHCMKNIALLCSFVFMIVNTSVAQSSKQKAVEQTIEQLRKAMIDADSAALDMLTAKELSYGHSSGHIDNKQEFIIKITSGKSDFVTIDLLEQTISIVKNTAVVRHKLNATTNDNGKPGEVHLAVLLIFQKQQGGWKLLARQAVKQQ